MMCVIALSGHTSMRINICTSVDWPSVTQSPNVFINMKKQ